MRAAASLLALASFALFATAAFAQEPLAPRLERTVTPRLVNEVQMRQLAKYDPALNPFKSRPPGYNAHSPNEALEYGARGFRSLVPEYTAPASDGPLVAQSVQTYFDYQPHVTTSFGVRDTGFATPGDCTIAAGPSHLVVAFNQSLAIYDKAGNQTWFSSLDGLLGATAGWKGHFDPKVVYDEVANRFYLVALDVSLTERRSVWSVAVSVTSNPNQGWYVYGQMENQWGGEGIDYEDLGFGSRGLYLTGNYISFADWAALPGFTTDHTSMLWIMDKAAMLAGNAATIWSAGDLPAESSQPVFLQRVAQVQAPPMGLLDGFVTGWQNMNVPANTVRISVWGVSLPANFPAGGPAFDRRTIDRSPPPGFANAQQSGGPARLQGDNMGAGQLSLYFRNGTLSMPVPVGSGSFSAARVLQLNVAWPTITVATQIDYTDNLHYHQWPNVAVNARGQTMLSYYRSGTDEFCGFRCATRLWDESAFGQSKIVKAGESYVGNPLTDTAATLHRWGDYSGVTVDPVTQGFWMFGMYANERGNNNGSDFQFWCGYVPRAVYVDFAYVGSESGTTLHPFNTLVEGMNDSFYNNEVVVKAGTYAAGGVLSRPVTIIPDGGTVVVTP